ncbi:hypothetical protein, partial [Salmonella enterica]|uniref:hypothetical protein n=1 Tax=Salmonella enterica TaxID=28901 RepID=UPI001A7E6B4B
LGHAATSSQDAFAHQSTPVNPLYTLISEWTQLALPLYSGRDFIEREVVAKQDSVDAPTAEI